MNETHVIKDKLVTKISLTKIGSLFVFEFSIIMVQFNFRKMNY